MKDKTSENNTFVSTPSAPISPFALPMPLLNEGEIEYYFIIKRRNFFCYKKYLKLEISDTYYIINIFVSRINNSILKIPKNKSKNDIIDILKTIGISNKHIFKIQVMSDNEKLSKKYLYNLEAILNFINKTETIMENVKYN